MQDGLDVVRPSWTRRYLGLNGISMGPIRWKACNAACSGSSVLVWDYLMTELAREWTTGSIFPFSLIGDLVCSKGPSRVLLFNCTSGRSGSTFLSTMLATAGAQLKIHGRAEDPQALFDHVIFCANVTYADGGFKGGASPLVSTTFRTSLTVAQTWQPAPFRKPTLRG